MIHSWTISVSKTASTKGKLEAAYLIPTLSSMEGQVSRFMIGGIRLSMAANKAMIVHEHVRVSLLFILFSLFDQMETYVHILDRPVPRLFDVGRFNVSSSTKRSGLLLGTICDRAMQDDQGSEERGGKTGPRAANPRWICNASYSAAS